MDRTLKPEIWVLPSTEALIERATAWILERAQAAVAARGVFRWALAGGSTPLGLYRRLGAEPARRSFPWEETEFFLGDERLVDTGDADRNERRIREAFGAAAAPPALRLVAVPPGPDPSSAAAAYDALLAERAATGGAAPLFDLVLLGVGGDGHTASLFPGSFEPNDPRLAIATRAPVAPLDRVSLTLRALASTRSAAFLVTGPDKSSIVARALAGEPGLPAGLVAPPEGELLWWLDRDAASALRR